MEGSRAQDSEMLVSNETLAADSPLIWPNQKFCEPLYQYL